MLQITLVGPSGKPVFQFSKRASTGRTKFTKKVPTFDLEQGSHLTLKVALISNGKRHTTSVVLKV